MSLKSIARPIINKLLSWQRSEFKFVWILIAVFSFITISPLIPSQGIGIYGINLLLSFIILSGILAASDERQMIRQIAFVELILMTLDWVRSLADNLLPGMVSTFLLSMPSTVCF